MVREITIGRFIIHESSRVLCEYTCSAGDLFRVILNKICFLR